jgi:hypothetical protein
MKRIFLSIIAAIMIIPGILSQNIDDALRYSQVFYTGTARFISMGGAFTSLGADLSSISLNPAGAGMFRSFEISISPQLIYNNAFSTFNSARTDDFRYTFGLANGGIVTNIISGNGENGLAGLSFAYSYNRTNNFNENVTISGISDNSSMADYWARISEGTYYGDLTGPEGIAYDAWIMDTISGSGGYSYGTIFSNYGENTNSTYGQTIRRVISNEGYTGEHLFTIGGNYSNKLYFGASIGISRLVYTGHYEHLEADYDNVVPDFKYFTYTDHFETHGTGFSMKLGAILRPVEPLRIGLAFHSPVLYRLHEYFYDNVASEFDNFDQYEATNDPLRYSYTFTSPFRVLTGVSLQLKKLGVISADYEFTDYRMARFSRASDDYNYTNENESIKNILSTASNLRLGAEFRISSLYLRAGYGLYGSAFTKGEVNENLNYNSISFGLGFRQDNFFFDMGFSKLSGSEKYYMYDDPPYLAPATIASSKNTFTATAGVKF